VPRRLALVLAVLVTAALVQLSPLARAASPASGTLQAPGDRVAWTGGPFAQSNGTDPVLAPCRTLPSQAGCDHYALTVGTSTAPTLVVEVRPADPSDDVDVYLYGPDGLPAGDSETTPTAANGGVETVTIDAPAAGAYDIYVQAFAVKPGATYSGAAGLVGTGTAYGDDTTACLEPVPDQVGVAGVTDDGRRVSLDVTVLVDDTVTLQRAEEVFAYAKTSYDPLKIDLNVTRYLPVSLPSDGSIRRAGDGKTVGRSTGDAALAYAKQVMGGSRPPDSDVVYLLTDKDLYSPGDDNTPTDLLGLADCIGGVRFDQHAFAVGELGDYLASAIGPASFLGNAGSKTASHEIGHLLGAQHHYFDCVEGLETETTDGEFSPCTIMAPLVDFGSINFGVLDGAVVRGHALTYAGGNDALAAKNRAATSADGGAGGSGGSASGAGYALLGEDGGIFTFGSARFYGSTGDRHLNQPVVGMAWTPTGSGYWIVARDGGIFTFGDANFYGSTGGMRLNAPILGMESSPTGRGYWLVASDGGIFTFGDAGFYGSTGDRRLNAPVVGLGTTSTGKGYWLVASDGGIFTFGDAGFYGSTGDRKLNQPVFDLAATSGDGGYWLVARDGGIFTFGDAGFHGSSAGTTSSPVIGMAATPTDGGYWIATRNGGVANFGDAPALGNLSNQRLNAPIVGFAAS
jgi:hypothetical protein